MILNIYIFLSIMIFLIISLYTIDELSEKRGRNSIFWIIFSFFITPMFSIIFLLILGETDEKRIERIKEEEQWKEGERIQKYLQNKK